MILRKLIIFDLYILLFELLDIWCGFSIVCFCLLRVWCNCFVCGSLFCCVLFWEGFLGIDDNGGIVLMVFGMDGFWGLEFDSC